MTLDLQITLTLRGFSNLSKLPEDQFPPSFSPPTSLLRKGPSLFFNHFVLPILQPTDRPTVLLSSVTLSHSACFLPRLSDRPTDRRFHLSPVSPFLRLLTALCMNFTSSDSPTDRRTDRRTVGRSVGWNQPSEGPLYEFHLLPTHRRTDRPTDRP